MPSWDKTYSFQLKFNYESWNCQPFDSFSDAEECYNQHVREMREDYEYSKGSDYAWSAEIRVVSVLGKTETPYEVLLYKEFP